MSSEPVSLLCQYGTGILSPGEGGREGRDGRRGGRAEEGGRESGGEGGERERERANVGRARFLRSSVIDENVCFLLFRCICAVAAAARLCERVCVCVFSLGRRRVCCTGMQQSTVKAAVAGACMAAERQQLPIKPINKSFCAVDVCFLLCC